MIVIDFDSCRIGKVWPVKTFDLIAADIIQFAKQWDPQPFHADPELAKSSFYGGITAPSSYLFCITSKLFNEMGEFSGIGALKHEFEIPSPARAGDTLTFKFTCIEKRVSKSKPDRGIVKFELTLMTQNNDMVLKQYSTIMLYRTILTIKD
ncbi:MAG: MaoC family dehydratase N-terminal domain-containing protein [Colwellia sp.]|jgi:Acyl dehydratase